MSLPTRDERIQVDTSSDDDSHFDTQSVVDSSLSLASSVRDYTYENGRRYHAYRHGQYPMPNDEEEQDRLMLLHHLFRLIIGGNLFRAPIAQSRITGTANNTRQRILDLGTGTGSWVLDMAEDFPQAEIIGVDLSPIQPHWAPPNCRFFVDDIESDWTFRPEEAFDFIHARSLAGGIADWDRMLQQAFAHVKPGGWVEIQECEPFIVSDDATHELAVVTQEWHRKLRGASRQFGKALDVVSSIGWRMQRAGFVNVIDDVYKCPIGTWPKNRRLKEIGQVGKFALLESIEPYSLALFTRILGYTYEEANETLNRARAELLNNNSLHLYVQVHYVYGQRPRSG
ncbi:hypothetical protein MPDQ_007670 [Monascus purpureus]|uniref:Methyltransferase n=1 Tax=Monascus purpureus TaxID=5098 RepID=A0A507QTV6_MONPU|nr:hypothetical protein MPDQ_007670 [Monascus purpureus]BDD55176.1 hypothetical protein MAP00_000723 [Monascus purpureus]